MGIEVNSSSCICSRCGIAYGKRKGYFAVSYASLYKGIGYMTVCKECVDSIYNNYLSIIGDPRRAVRQVCRKLDLYWADSVFDMVEKKSVARSMMTNYIVKINTSAYVGKTYDDTLINEGTMWSDGCVTPVTHECVVPEEDKGLSSGKDSSCTKREEEDIGDFVVTDEIVMFWGRGYTPEMYRDLEQRREYWMSRLPDIDKFDAGTEAIIRQICNLEIDINRDRMDGKSIDKNVNALNTLLGSACLRPTQRKDESAANVASTPLGVWLWRYENERPLPEIDEDLKDVNHIKKYIFTWMGHLCKMVGVKNGFTKLYEEEVARLKVDLPEYGEDEEEDLIIDAYSRAYDEETSSDNIDGVDMDGQ